MSVRVPRVFLISLALTISLSLGVFWLVRGNVEGENSVKHVGLGVAVLYDRPEPTEPAPTTLLEAWDIAFSEGRNWSPRAEIVGMHNIESKVAIDAGSEGKDGKRTAWEARVFDTERPTNTLVVRITNGKPVYAAIEPGGLQPDQRFMIRPSVDSAEAMAKVINGGLGLSLESQKVKATGYGFNLRNDSGRITLNVVGSTQGTDGASVSFDADTGEVTATQVYAPSPTFGGVLYSKDGGKTWAASNLRGMILAPTVDSRGVALAFRVNVTALELWQSVDGGRDWTQISTLPAEMGPWAFTASEVDLPQGRTLLLSTRTGLWMSRDGGKTWLRNETIPDGVPQYFTTVSGPSGTSVVASVVDGPATGKTYISSDLNTWQVLFDGLRWFSQSPDGSSALALDPRPGMLKADIVKGQESHEMPIPIGALRAAGDSNPSGHLLVQNGNELAVSSNGGNDWQVTGRDSYAALAVSPAFDGDGVALASIFRGRLDRSEDYGMTWQQVLKSPGSIVQGGGISRIVFASPTAVFAVNQGANIWLER